MKFSVFFLLCLFTLPAAASTNTTTNTQHQLEYTLIKPVSWTRITNENFRAVWIRDKKDHFSPQIYLSVHYGIPEPAADKMGKLKNQMAEIVSRTPDGKVINMKRSRVRGMLRIDFTLRYSVYKNEKKIRMGKNIRSFFGRGDQYLFMTLYRMKHRTAAIKTFNRTTASFRINPNGPRKQRSRGLIMKAYNTVKKYWFILLPLFIFAGVVVWKDRKKQVDRRG